MKIKVEKEKIISALRKLEGIEIVLEDANDAKEAMELILAREDLFGDGEYAKPKDVKVTHMQEYRDSSVDYRILYLLDFIFEDEAGLGTKVSFIKKLQDFFNKG